MRDETDKLCINCRHCIRSKDEKYGIIFCRCDMRNRYLSYADALCGRCRKWEKEIDNV